MRVAAKILAVAVALAGLFLLTFALWGDAMETMFARDAFAAHMASARSLGWLAGLGLLVADLVLPVPATGVMSALGTVYGFWAGWLIGATGSALAGVVGYAAVRIGGDRIAARLAGPEEMRDFRSLFDRWGGLAIIASRALPILPEVMAVLAGLAGMRFRLFLAAMLAGTIPVSGLYAWWGSYAGATAPGTSFLIAVIVPVIAWALLLPVLRRCRRSAADGANRPSRASASSVADPSPLQPERPSTTKGQP